MKKKSKNISTRGSTMDSSHQSLHMVDVRWFDQEFIHESWNVTTLVKCPDCMDEKVIVMDVSPGNNIAGLVNCPACGDGKRIEHG